MKEPYELCLAHRKEIGKRLSNLRMAKKYPDNYTLEFINRNKDLLSICMRSYKELLIRYPSLKRPKQLSLF